MTRSMQMRMQQAALAWLVLAACRSQPDGAAGPEAAPTSPEPAPVASEPATPAVDEVEPLVALMQGSFSSREQALADPEYFDIRLHMLPIFPERDDGRWLYVEQAVATAQDQPYRQRVYRVAPGDDGTIVSAVYTIEEPQRFALAWQDPAKLQALRHEDLTLKEGCEVVLRQQAPQRFVGATAERRCASDLRGASWASSEVTVTAEGLLSWDRGFDDAGQQVWGATKGGYRFLHDDPQAPPAVPPAKAGQ